MFKEPISYIYRQRGKAGRIRRMKKGKHKAYNMFTSKILRVVPPRRWFNKLIQPGKWRG